MISKQRTSLRSRRSLITRPSNHRTASVKPDAQLSFKTVCDTCGAQCCKPLLQEPIYHINIGLEAISFIEHNLSSLLTSSGEYTNGVPNLSLKPHMMGYCPFLDYPTSTCTIYKDSYRPRACHSFPFTKAYDPILNQKCLYKQKETRKRFKILGNQVLQECNKKLPPTVPEHNQLVKQISDYWIKQDNWLLNERSQIVQKNDHGIFFVFDSPPNSILDLFFTFVTRYANSMEYTEIFVNVFILDASFQEIGQVVGAYAPQQTLERTDIRKFAGRYYNLKDKDGHFPLNLLMGVCLENELTIHPPHWDECLSIMKRLARSRE